LDQRSIFFFF
jgi:hypothetical protein